jgi:hypothetical protein
MDEHIYREIIEACRPFYLYYPSSTSASNCPSHHHHQQDLTAFAGGGANRFLPSSTTNAIESSRLLEAPASTTNDGDRAGLNAYSTAVSSCPARALAVLADDDER